VRREALVGGKVQEEEEEKRNTLQTPISATLAFRHKLSCTGWLA
jgi:hypothetical protein